MAEEKKVIVDIEIRSEDIKAAKAAMDAAAKASAQLTAELNALKDQQKENTALYKTGAINAEEYAKRQAETKIQLTELNKQLSSSNKEFSNNKTVVDAANGSNEQLKARLSLLTAEYNSLSKEERENTKTGQQLQATIKTISDKLKENEKAVGDNRRNVGNYEEALKSVAGKINIMGVNLGQLSEQLTTYRDGIKAATSAQMASATATGGLVGALQILKVALIATGIGAIVVALGTMATFLTQTKRGSELLAQGLSAIGATVSVITDRISQLGESLVKVFQGDLKGAAETAKGAFSGIADEIARESKAALELEKRTQKLTDAERALSVERSRSRAQIKELNKIAEDTTKSYSEREKAARTAISIEQKLLDDQVKIAEQQLDIITKRNAMGESLAEDLDKQAEAEIRVNELRQESLELQTTLQNKLNTIRQQQHAEYVKQEQEKIRITEQEIEARKKAEEEIRKGYENQRQMIDDLSELKRNQAIINIADAEQQAEAIAAIDRQALLDKIAVIDEETAAYTASAEYVGSVDEQKYADQLALRAKYEAELKSMERGAISQSFTDQVEAYQRQEQLDIQQAELTITNAENLEKEKQRIALKYAELKLAAMRKFAESDGVLTQKELQNLKEVENTVQRLKNLIDQPSAQTAAESLGLSQKDIDDMTLGLNVVNGLLQSISSAVAANSQNRIKEIEQRTDAEIAAVEKSGASEEQKQAKIDAINKRAARERYKIELEQFKTGKALSIALAIANTATAVVAQLSNPTPYAGFVLAALAAATGAVQIGIISAQKPPPPPTFAKGGILNGASHAQGGIQLFGRSGDYYGEAEGGEPILTKGVSQDPALLSAASAINVAAGGRPLVPARFMATGGIASPTFAARQATVNSTAALEQRIEVLGDRIAQMQPVVRVTDINRVQGQVANVQSTSDLH